MKIARIGLTVILPLSLSGCFIGANNVDEDLSLPDAKARTQAVERQIADALPGDLVVSIDQNETGSFLSCTSDGGEQWAGGLTARVQAGASAEQLLEPVSKEFEAEKDMSSQRWQRDGDDIVEIVGLHQSSWIVRYAPDREEVHVSSFSPCIRLPEGVWRGDTY
ncbi:hypothetical protein [Microbacterium enclense]|uniref:Lipoprotein n=1 Tax=Microbacterium enclense TaxID=993073 RepID=A0A1G6HAM8_9MICO|nr:hypothetical protein [Microbacterium enclense]SDB91349.1 hypothetical protein SAMN05216418_0991 [Microbacterium enclense]